MEKILEQTLLYDFYGDLLTEHQRKIYKDAVFEDLSLSEIAENSGVSRQGVHDLIKRCNNLLAGYEESLHLVSRFLRLRKQAGEINNLSSIDNMEDAESKLRKIHSIASEILEEL